MPRILYKKDCGAEVSAGTGSAGGVGTFGASVGGTLSAGKVISGVVAGAGVGVGVGCTTSGIVTCTAGASGADVS